MVAAHREVTAYKAREMQTRYTIHIMPSEWRWVVAVGCSLVLLAFLPLLWVALAGTGDWQFMGVLHNYLDGATYLSKMRLGVEGEWRVYFMHTPELHNGAFIQILYPFLGHVSRTVDVPPIILFHVGRVGAALFMYFALYQLAATIWMRVRTRRVFFAVAVLGAGFGWLLGPVTGQTLFPDFPLIPEAFLFFSTFMNVHFPLTLGLLAWLASLFISAFRPGAEGDPSIGRLWPLAGLISVALGLLYPQALVPFGAAVLLYMASLLFRGQRIPSSLWRWMLALILPAVPLALYYLGVVLMNPAMRIWNAQNVTEAPPLHVLLLGFGLPLLVGLPAIYRALRRFEMDGDRLMLLWLFSMLLLIYLPTNIQRRFAVGMMIPIAYFATRAIEDVWLRYISRRWRMLLLAVFLPLISMSQLLMLFLPVIPAVGGSPERAVGIFLQRDYAITLNALHAATQRDDVVLAAPVVGAWVPGWASARVVYGHPYETLNADQREQDVLRWYEGADPAFCAELIDRYNIRFILYGPQEAGIGPGCLEGLREVARAGTVTVYAP